MVVWISLECQAAVGQNGAYSRSALVHQIDEDQMMAFSRNLNSVFKVYAIVTNRDLFRQPPVS